MLSQLISFFVDNECLGTVFQTAALFMFINPETSSRVTLATLGTVFQTD